jgi:hypothetical protein
MNEKIVLIFGLLSFFGLVLSFVNAIMMGRYLEKKGIKVKWWFFRFLIYKYIKQYKELTIQENGEPGPLYYRFIYSFIFLAISLSTTLLVLIYSR